MVRTPLAFSLALSISLVAEVAFAQQETCPPGSTWKSQGGAGWCEPSVCAADMDCKSGEVCKPIPLCVEIGKTEPGTDGGVLMARQKCGENKSCPSGTVCSDKGRCLSKDAAEKLGLLGAPGAKTDGSSAPPKKACGCTTPGAPIGNAAAALVGLGLAVCVVRRRVRR